jgi:hypothetical protein
MIERRRRLFAGGDHADRRRFLEMVVAGNGFLPPTDNVVRSLRDAECVTVMDSRTKRIIC